MPSGCGLLLFWLILITVDIVHSQCLTQTKQMAVVYNTISMACYLSPGQSVLVLEPAGLLQNLKVPLARGSNAQKVYVQVCAAVLSQVRQYLPNHAAELEAVPAASRAHKHLHTSCAFSERMCDRLCCMTSCCCRQHMLVRLCEASKVMATSSP